MNEIDIWRAADELVRRFGANADYQAEMRARAARRLSKPEEANAWTLVGQAIGQLDSQKPILGIPLN